MNTLEKLNLVIKELAHLVRLLEPMEQEGSLDVPGLATLNGARRALRLATEPESAADLKVDMGIEFSN